MIIKEFKVNVAKKEIVFIDWAVDFGFVSA